MTIVDRLRALLAKATPGPWTVSDDEPGDVVLYGPDENWMANIGNWARQHEEIDAKAAARQACEFRDAADAQLMAAMRDALPALLDVAEAAAEHAWHNCQCGANYSTCSACRLREALAKLSVIENGRTSAETNVIGDEK